MKLIVGHRNRVVWNSRGFRQECVATNSEWDMAITHISQETCSFKLKLTDAKFPLSLRFLLHAVPLSRCIPIEATTTTIIVVYIAISIIVVIVDNNTTD